MSLQDRLHNTLHACRAFIHHIYNDITQFFMRLQEAFGWNFVVSVIIIYGVNQGLGEGWLMQLHKYYLKDILQLSASDAQSMTAVAHTAWNIKPLYGVFSDGFPILGYHKTYYIALASIVGTYSWLMLSWFVLSVVTAVAMMALGNISIAAPDVMVDALVAEKSKKHPYLASDLQALCFGSLAVFGILGTLSSGILIHYVGIRNSYTLVACTSMILLLPTLFSWLHEKRKYYIFDNHQIHLKPHYISETNNNETLVLQSKPLFSFDSCIFTFEILQRQKLLFCIALLITFIAVSLSIAVVVMQDAMAKAAALSVAVILVCVILYTFLHRHYAVLTKVAIFIFIRECVQLDIEQALFYWYTEAENGPKFSSELVGFISTAGFVAMLVGVLVYNKYLSSYQYRTVFFYVQVLFALTNLLDLVFVYRWNLALGIPDVVFIMGDTALSPLIRRILHMPTCILAAKLCPDGSEATIFSLLMSLSNFGHDIAGYYGASLLSVMHIGDPGYADLPLVILLKSLTRVLPIFLIPLLVPPGCPTDSVSELRQHDRILSHQNSMDDSTRQMDDSSSSSHPIIVHPRTKEAIYVPVVSNLHLSE